MGYWAIFAYSLMRWTEKVPAVFEARTGIIKPGVAELVYAADF